MKIIDSEFSHHIVKSVHEKLGDIYFFNHIAVIEFNEGVHVDVSNTTDIIEKLTLFFGMSRPFGVIANRINSYSINLLDIIKIQDKVKNLSAYSVVSHNAAGYMNAEIESNFCSRDNIHFDNINEAINFVYSKVKSKIQISLN
ncbi:hypothetical protein ACFFU1_08305 [Algibacter miyuki]|uniref:Uncharacterized protein n=1 Tax=Algibacter miyuki TaxID=1306933 RepID=A0ABV5GZ23_9FLAO|nr:hypothetical protein [Algibacter miyuki]MDN3666905.1 hypothetical protein [Algibacter miyuki]